MTYQEAIEYAFNRQATGIMEKDGKYLTAKDWNEIKYAKSCGWNYIGHPVDLIADK